MTNLPFHRDPDELRDLTQVLLRRAQRRATIRFALFCLVLAALTGSILGYLLALLFH